MKQVSTAKKCIERSKKAIRYVPNSNQIKSVIKAK